MKITNLVGQQTVTIMFNASIKKNAKPQPYQTYTYLGWHDEVSSLIQEKSCNVFLKIASSFDRIHAYAALHEFIFYLSYVRFSWNGFIQMWYQIMS